MAASVIARFPSFRRLPGAPPEGVRTVLDFLRHRYPRIPAEIWTSRFERGLVQVDGRPLTIAAPFVAGQEIRYFREVFGAEPDVRRDVRVVHDDADLLVVDKPHLLPVVPSGPYVENCLLAIMRDLAACPDLVPLHRLDRDTAGLVCFSRRKATRAALAALFAPGRVKKSYRAIAEMRGSRPPRVQIIRGHIAMDVPFWRRKLLPDAPGNSETRATLLGTSGSLAYFRLDPLTGKTHQLRLHLASIGCPIVNDLVYGEGRMPGAGQVSTPLQLLAARLELRHPVSGERLRLRSTRRLAAMVLL